MKSSDFYVIIGNIALDPAYRRRFLHNVEDVIADAELTPVDMMTLRKMSHCSLTHFGTGLVNKSHAHYRRRAESQLLATT